MGSCGEENLAPDRFELVLRGKVNLTARLLACFAKHRTSLVVGYAWDGVVVALNHGYHCRILHYTRFYEILEGDSEHGQGRWSVQAWQDFQR